ncbi:phosphate transport system regulator related protein [Halorhabdus tiamatea SARL4B]|uniref:Phosphate transport system regulator related protein n=1 Tax=Halorhabdus tiamatea SARL4B TaxID=1033806 RepID=F7PHY2_9EURY|nr:helix-turn-helix domain-containing protein [Halorhabdus tiamatea]ERJ06574.1 phosphate transport system regulator related protein [Halorhabdus tiamatea SARL4B]
MPWHQSNRPTGREATVAHVIEAIDATAPETKEELADQLDLSTHYVSEIFQELKSEGIISKSYVIDNEAVYETADAVSPLRDKTSDGTDDVDHILDLFQSLYDIVRKQYQAAKTLFLGDNPQRTAEELEPVTNERYGAVLSELRSYTLSTKWPGNRVAADLASIAKDLEIVGDRSSFISEVVSQAAVAPSGTVKTRLIDIFESGENISDIVETILFGSEVSQISTLHSTEKQTHRQISELYELATAFDVDIYGHLVVLIRTVERVIHHWVNVGELAVQIRTGLDPGHVEL